LKHSDVIVTVASTIAIEASIRHAGGGRSFDGETPEEFSKSARRYCKFTHYANITVQPAVAETPEALG
jgi:hypothetical protein